MPFEKKLFKMLQDPEPDFSKFQKYLRKQYGIEVGTMDQFYMNLDENMKIIFPDKKRWWPFGRKEAA